MIMSLYSMSKGVHFRMVCFMLCISSTCGCFVVPSVMLTTPGELEYKCVCGWEPE